MTNKSKILIVEDDEFLRGLCEKKLSNAGFEVCVAFDGEGGLKKVRDEKPDLILLDIILPRIDGFKVLKQLKKDSATASIPVIFLTNLGQKEDAEKGLALGADDFLVKAHFTTEEIVEKVKQLISTKKDR